MVTDYYRRTIPFYVTTWVPWVVIAVMIFWKLDPSPQKHSIPSNYLSHPPRSCPVVLHPPLYRRVILIYHLLYGSLSLRPIIILIFIVSHVVTTERKKHWRLGRHLAFTWIALNWIEGRHTTETGRRQNNRCRLLSPRTIYTLHMYHHFSW